MRSIRYVLHRLNVYGRLKRQEICIADLKKRLDQQNEKLKKLNHMQNGQRLANLRDTEKRIHFIHIFGTNNVGDEYCGPEFFFGALFEQYDQYIHSFSSIDYQLIRPDDVVVIGGGGLIDYSDGWNERINACIDRCRNVVLWGCGLNHHKDRTAVTKPVNLSGAALIGVRDYRTDDDYIPCASCMLPQFQREYPIRRRVGVAEHKDFPIREFPSYEKIDNATDHIDAVIEFIGSSEIIITNTYHIWYWATLMNKKVILYDKFSTKFDSLRYEPVMYSGDLEEDIKRCKTYPDALSEAIGLNRKFADRVKGLLIG